MIKNSMQSTALKVTKWLLSLAMPLLVAHSVFAQANYIQSACTDPYTPVQGTVGATFIGAGDDATFIVNLPFTFNYYNIGYTNLRVGTNGFISFPSTATRGLGNATLPTALVGASMYPFWDDLDADVAVTATSGIYSRVDGVAPNRIFTIEWKNIGHFNHSATTGDITFEVRLFETSGRFEFKYLDVEFAGTQTTFNNGLSATVGIEGVVATPRLNTLVGFNTASVTNGQCIAFTVPPPCNVQAPLAAINQNVTAATCLGQPIAVPAISGTCAGITLMYSINGGAAQSVPAGATTIPALAPGVYNIVWSTPTSTSPQAVTVVDNIAPTIVCPADIVVNLGSGACRTSVNYPIPTAADNCPFIGPAQTLTTLFTGGNSNFGNVFDLTNSGTAPLTINGLAVNAQSAATTVDVFIRTGTYNGFTGSNVGWTQVVAGAAITFAGANQPSAVAGVNFVIQPGVTGVYVRPVTGGFNYTNGNGANQTFTTGPLRFDGGLGLVNFGGTVFNPRIWNGRISFQEVTSATPVLISGPASGEQFEIGTTAVTYRITDSAGNTADCSFNVTVNENPIANPVLACQDNVQVSVDATCTAVVTPAMLLTGGPFGCFETRYSVMILDATGAPRGNTVGRADIGRTFTVKVTDLVTGNACWGSIIVEDKIKPVVQCEDLTLPCSAPANASSATITAVSAGNVAIPDANPAGVTDVATVAGLPADASITDVNLTLDIDHTWVGDLTIELTSPGGQSILLWDGLCGATDNLKVKFDDQSPDCVNACASYNAGFNVVQTPSCLVAQFGAGAVGAIDLTDVLAKFNYGNPNGNWSLFVSDGVGGDVGRINNFTLEITYVSAATPYVPVVIENCTAFTLSSADEVIPGGCNGAARTIRRTWKATDASGNVSDPCVQVITFEKPNITAIAFPDNITFTCDQYAAFPNVIGANARHPFITDTDLTTPTIIDVNLIPTQDDNDVQDNPAINSTNAANGGTGVGLGLEDADVLALTGAGVPSIGGAPITNGSICNFTVVHQDLTIDDLCPGSTGGTFKVRRKWIVTDWCTGEEREFNQLIKVADKTAPTFADCPAAGTTVPVDVTSSSAAQNSTHMACTGNILIPGRTVNADNCSGLNPAGYRTELFERLNTGAAGALIGSVNSNGGAFNNIAIEDANPLTEGIRYIVRHVAKDFCGNESVCEYTIFVRDRVQPVAVCDNITELSLTNNGPNGQSCTTLFPEDLDDGSYDNCGEIFFLAAKMDAASFATGLYGRCYYPTLEFCCNETGPQQVILLVLDKDPSAFFFNPPLNTPFFGCNGTTSLFLAPLNAQAPAPYTNIGGGANSVGINFNSCMVTVNVTDKLPPSCAAPANRAIDCDTYFATYEAISVDNHAAWDAAFGTATISDNCTPTTVRVVTKNIDNCGRGTITRRWTVTDSNPQNRSSVCVQTITVGHVSNWVVEFPDDLDVVCTNQTTFDINDPSTSGEPIIFFETCELIGTTYEDRIFTNVPGACFKVERTWTVINWCIYDANLGNTVIESSETAIVTGRADINNDFSIFSYDAAQDLHPAGADAGDGVTAPNDDHTPEAGDIVPNDSRTFQDGLNVGNWSRTAALKGARPDGYITYKQVIKINDNTKPTLTCANIVVCENSTACGPVFANLEIPIADACSDMFQINYTIDAFNNGSIDFTGTGFASGSYPLGTHSITYVVKDRCGNVENCTFTFEIKDCKKPTPYCKNGLVIEIMQTGMVQTWASDFNAGSFDNCPGRLRFSFSSNVADTGRTFTCATLGAQPVEIWVTDLAGNQDFCTTFVDIQDNMGACDPIAPRYAVGGAIATDANALVSAVNVELNGATNFSTSTDVNGTYNFASVPAANDYTITPMKDTNPLNGVTTFDLVLISRHVLGIANLDSPYKIIAADANHSNSVTTADLVALRKLILLVSAQLPNNTSWRFVPKSYVFPNPANPFAPGVGYTTSQPFPEVININNLSANQLAADFVGLKVGDVNNNAVTNLLSLGDRTFNGETFMTATDVAMKSGNKYSVEITAADVALYGYQFTMNFDNKSLTFEDMVPGIASAENFGLALLEEGVITASWNADNAKQFKSTDVLFTLVFTANADVQLSNALTIDSRYTAAEAYAQNGDLLNIGLSFENGTVSNEFALYQNTPNPFGDVTTIGFNLPTAGKATMTITDVTGKVLVTINGAYAKGFNQVTVNRSQLPAAGVVYYKLDTPSNSATKSMIIID